MVHASSFFWAELQINLTKPVTMGMQWRKYHCTIAGGPHHVAVLSKSTVYPHFLQKLIITFPNNINVMFNDNINQKNHIICFFILPAYIHLVWWTPPTPEGPDVCIQGLLHRLLKLLKGEIRIGQLHLDGNSLMLSLMVSIRQNRIKPMDSWRKTPQMAWIDLNRDNDE